MNIDIASLGPAARKQIMEKLGAQEKKRKYNTSPTKVGSIKFDSQKEAARYQELMLRLRAGRIQDLKLQPQFTLQESYITPEGKRVRAIKYVADFSYFDCDKDKDVVEDVKSRATKTRVYAIKKKLMAERFEIEVQEV